MAAAAASMMPYFAQQISSKNDLVPDWMGQEVSTGVSTCCWTVAERTGLGSVSVERFLHPVKTLNETALLRLANGG